MLGHRLALFLAAGLTAGLASCSRSDPKPDPGPGLPGPLRSTPGPTCRKS
jgi:hypothetical protein